MEGNGNLILASDVEAMYLNVGTAGSKTRRGIRRRNETKVTNYIGGGRENRGAG